MGESVDITEEGLAVVVDGDDDSRIPKTILLSMIVSFLVVLVVFVVVVLVAVEDVGVVIGIILVGLFLVMGSISFSRFLIHSKSWPL